MTNTDRLAELQALKREVMRSIHCAVPGTVLSFDAETATAVIRPASENLPLLKDVPVFMPVPFEISEGDGCLVVFADHEIDSWMTGEECPSGRTHSLSDGFAFVGFKRMNNEQ